GSHIVRFVAPVLTEYMTRYPELSVELTMGERMVDLVEEGFDLAIRATVPADSSLVIRQLAAWRHVPCCSPGYLETHGAPRAPADLARHNCLRYAFYPYGDEWRFAGPGGEAVSARVKGSLRTNSAEAMRIAALAGIGIFLAPGFLVAEDLAAGRLVRLLEAYRPVAFAINAIYPHRAHVPAKIRGFIDLAVERLGTRPEWIMPAAPLAR
ncbi:MAG TPA: substrate binding domain-containing protein, partial [Dongiaceae bacterium]|nr:substrate binding domain-containing protein [Dongiaceae bacterium]